MLAALRIASALLRWRTLPLCLWLAACAAPGYGAAPARDAPGPWSDIGDYHHTRWTADEGAPTAIRAMAQTTDGWLWLGTLDGLYRFDGLRFTRYPLPSSLGLNRNLIIYLRAGANGELYISRAAEGISVLHPDGRLQALPPLPSVAAVVALAVDTDGSTWVVSNGILHLQGGQWRTVEDSASWKDHEQRSFLVDQRGQLWATNDRGTWRLDRDAGRFERILDVGGDLLTAPDGRLWLVSDDGEVRLISDAGTGVRPSLSVHAEAAGTAQFGPDGTLWALNCPGQLCLVEMAARRADSRYNIRTLPNAAVTRPVPLSGRTPQGILVDREGNIWINTDTGLDRFHRNRFSAARIPGPGTTISLASDRDGRVWAAEARSGTLWQVRPGGIVPVPRAAPVTVLALDPAGNLILGGRRSIRRGDEDIPLPPGPDGKPADLRLMGILDDGKVLWTATFETGLIAWRDGAWQPSGRFRLPAKIYQSARAGPGKLWLATGEGELFLYDVDRDRSGAPIDIRDVGMTSAIFPGAELVIGGDNGLGVVRNDVLSMLGSTHPNALRNISGQVVTPDGDRWLNGAAGLVHVTAADWRRSVDDPAIPLRFELFDGRDGYPGRAVIESRWASAWSGDGRHLWLVATGGVVLFDTHNVDRNQVAPTPTILALATETAVYHPSGPVRLPPGTDRFRFDFTAPALRKPERVRFAYRLDGVDAQWQDAGNRRSTSYTNVGPGDYVFRLRATNEDGMGSRTDAQWRVTVAPTAVQTTWFKLLVAAAAALLLACAYRYRVRHLTRRVAERMQVKLAERERIARTLHDTFLQTVHSLLLRVDAAAVRLPPGDETRRQLESALGHAHAALREGREHLQELRSSKAEPLEAMLDETISRLRAAHGGTTIGLRVEGAACDVAPDVAHEVAYVAGEALRNACMHARADHVRATLRYDAAALRLVVADNGQGIAGDVLARGAADGHWGLVGMRERAARIGASLEIREGAEGGTLVTLTVPHGRLHPAPGELRGRRSPAETGGG